METTEQVFERFEQSREDAVEHLNKVLDAITEDEVDEYVTALTTAVQEGNVEAVRHFVAESVKGLSVVAVLGELVGGVPVFFAEMAGISPAELGEHVLRQHGTKQEEAQHFAHLLVEIASVALDVEVVRDDDGFIDVGGFVQALIDNGRDEETGWQASSVAQEVINKLNGQQAVAEAA